MTKFFKGIGKGILYIIGFPILLVGLCLAGVACLFIFLFQLGKLIFLFFTGRNLFSDLDEDIQAKDIIARNNPSNQEEQQPLNNSSMSIYPSDSPVYGSPYEPQVQKEEAPKEKIEQLTIIDVEDSRDD